MEEEGSNEYMMPPDDAAAAAGSNGMGDPSAAAMVENNGMMESNSFMSMNEDHMTHVYQVRIHPPPPSIPTPQHSTSHTHFPLIFFHPAMRIA